MKKAKETAKALELGDKILKIFDGIDEEIVFVALGIVFKVLADRGKKERALVLKMLKAYAIGIIFIKTPSHSSSSDEGSVN